MNQALSASAVHNPLIPITKTVRTLYFLVLFRTTSNNSTLITQFADHRFRIPSFFFWWLGCRCYSAACRLEVFLDDDVRSFLQALQLGDVLLPLQLRCDSPGTLEPISCSSFWSINRGPPRTCLIFFFMFRCQHATLCGFLSTYGSSRTW